MLVGGKGTPPRPPTVSAPKPMLPPPRGPLPPPPLAPAPHAGGAVPRPPVGGGRRGRGRPRGARDVVRGRGVRGLLRRRLRLRSGAHLRPRNRAARHRRRHPQRGGPPPEQAGRAGAD